MKLIFVVLVVSLFSVTFGQWSLVSNITVNWPVWTDLGEFSNKSNPGPRFLHFMVQDKDPNFFWLGYGQADANEVYNDLWRYDISTAQWAWMTGDDKVVLARDYPIGSSKVPTARSGSNVWTDADGNIWFYGGQFGTVANMFYMADFWKYDTSNNTWNWISGQGNIDGRPIYNDYDVFDGPNAKPGGRCMSATWKDANGDFFMFGGSGYVLSKDGAGFLNNIWSFNPNTMKWTWIGGSKSSNRVEQTVHYGEIGVPSYLNWPLARHGSAAWYFNNTVYIFGGQINYNVFCNDVWTWSNNTWTWIAGVQPGDFIHTDPDYRYLGHWSDGHIGERVSAISWSWNNDLWVYGGFGYNVSATSLNDMWSYSTSLQKWAWLGPSATDNYPSPRNSMASITIGTKLLTYGGGDTVNGKLFSQLWQLDISEFNVSSYIASPEIPELSDSAPKGGRKSGTTPVAAIVVPIVVCILLAVAVSVFLYMRRRKYRQNVHNEVAMESVANNRLTLNRHGNNVEGVEIGQLIGVGNFGEVYQGKWQTTAVALKKLKPEYFSLFKKEVDTLVKLQHPQIVQYLGIYLSKENQYFIVMELMNYGNLQKLLQSGQTLSDSDLLTMAIDAASGLAYIHSNNIIHRDISLRNLLTSQVTQSERKFTTKISDFGMATLVSDSYYQSQNKVLPYKWASCEVLKFGKYSSASDVWAFGVTLWELYSFGAPPFPGLSNSEASEVILAGKRLGKPERCPEEVYSLMTQCWQEKSKDRPSMVDICAALKRLQGLSDVVVPNNMKPDEFYTLEEDKSKLFYHK